MKKIITLFIAAFAICNLNISAQCVMTGNANPGLCSPTTNTYDINGFVAYSGAPSTGTLTIMNSCGGAPITLLPPFSGSSSFTMTGLTANGATCNVLFYFSDLPTCMYSSTYTAPVACGATSVTENNFVSNLSIAPNPSNGSFNLVFDQAQIQTLFIEIVDVLGRVVVSQNLPEFVGTYNKKLNLTDFNKGIYFVRITGKNSSEIRKIIYY